MKALGKGSIASLVKAGLGVAWWLLWAAAAALGLGAVGYGALLVLINNGIIDASVLTGGDSDVRIGDDVGAISVSYDDPGGLHWTAVVPAFLIGAVVIAGALIIVWRLRRLFDSFSSGEPFRKENAQHLRVIWITMLAIEIARYLLMALTGFLIAQFGPDGAEASIQINIDISTWMSILILIVLAEVFRVGARMREEQDLTI